nr:hypothetical protein [Tanacetum cinerariifolium]
MNNHLRASSNTYNQVYVHDGRVNVKSKNFRNASRNTSRVFRNSRTAIYGQQANDLEELEELNATSIMMARLQSINNDTEARLSYDSDFANELNEEQDNNAHDQKNVELELLIHNVQLEAEKTNKINKVVKEQGKD